MCVVCCILPWFLVAMKPLPLHYSDLKNMKLPFKRPIQDIATYYERGVSLTSSEEIVISHIQCVYPMSVLLLLTQKVIMIVLEYFFKTAPKYICYLILRSTNTYTCVVLHEFHKTCTTFTIISGTTPPLML